MKRNDTRMPSWARGFDWKELTNGDNGSTLLACLAMITPAIAEQISRDNIREITPSRMMAYSRIMEVDDWELNGESLKFDADWQNTDGQHRLAACIKSTRPFRTLMIAGVGSVMEVDRGKPRSISEYLRHAGYANYASLASVLSPIWRYEKFHTFGGTTGIDRTPTVDEALTFIRVHPVIQDYVRIACRVKATVHVSQITPVLYCGVERAECGIQKADDFVNGLADPGQKSSGDARFVLAARMIVNSAAKAKLPFRDERAIIIKTWNRWLLGLSTSVGSIRWNVTEDYPDLITKQDLQDAGVA